MAKLHFSFPLSVVFQFASCISISNLIETGEVIEGWHKRRASYRLPFARLCVLQSIWQFLAELSPPLLHAET